MISDSVPEQLIAKARGGDPAALGHLLDLYRNYLQLVARSLIGVALRVRLEPSDLVQETFLKAHREFAGFAGRGEPELIAWLRRILVRTLANQVKHHRRQGRDHQRQESLEALLDRSGATVQQALASPRHRPAKGPIRREQAVLLADAVSRLPDDYREVFILRTLEHVPFEEIAAADGPLGRRGADALGPGPGAAQPSLLEERAMSCVVLPANRRCSRTRKPRRIRACAGCSTLTSRRWRRASRRSRGAGGGAPGHRRALAGLPLGPAAGRAGSRAMPTPTPRATPAVDCRVLGDFRHPPAIGRGGMGIVYEAEQVSLGRRVA